MGGTLNDRLDEYDAWDLAATPDLLARVRAARAQLAEAVAHVRLAEDERFRDYHARRLVETAIDIVCGYLLLRDAQTDARKLLAAQHFVDGLSARVMAATLAVLASTPAAVDSLAALSAD
jgi:3-(methylthio)propanoyl-CoA dehydrogenase